MLYNVTQLIIPAALATTIPGEKGAETMTAVPLSNDTIRRRIFNISDDLQEQPVEHLTDKCFVLQMDVVTDRDSFFC